VATALAAVSATIVCGVAQAADNSDHSGNGRGGSSQGDRSGLGNHLQRDGYGRYLSDPESFYYGPDDAPSSSTDSDDSDSDDEDSVENDNEWDEGLYDQARGGKGGAAGTNSSQCSMGLGQGMKNQQCKGGTGSHAGADGEARYIP
jgi:hypothetical protein